MVLVSETMLQQTRVDQVIPYFQKFIIAFPKAETFVKASEDNVLKIWEGLGYYTRAINLHKTVKIIMNKYGGSLPSEKSELLKLPGIGHYTANALLSLLFNKPYSVVDGNVIRVISRLFGINIDTRLLSTRNIIQSQMDELMDKDLPADFNESIMDFGATLCLPKNPNCNSCPLNKLCFANLNNQVNLLPFKSPNSKKPQINLVAFIIRNKTKLLIVRRPLEGLLPGMWEFPCRKIEKTDQLINGETKTLLKEFNIKAIYIKSLSTIKHTYSHFHLDLNSYLFQADNLRFVSEFYIQHRWIEIESLSDFAIHGAIQKLILKIKPQLKVVP